ARAAHPSEPMSMPRKLDLVLCWHMHQPDYRNYLGGDYVLPWTYLHAIKDYTDMAYHLENSEGKAVFNFVPILLEQLADYVDQFATGKVRDPLLKLLVRKDMETLTRQDRAHILDSCFRSNHHKMIRPYPAYSHLFDAFQFFDGRDDGSLEYLSGQYMADLLVWYHLAWTGESVRRSHETVASLMAKGSQFTYEDRKSLFDLIGELIKGIIPRYKALAESGKIELSTTPYYHPIMPLLLDFGSAKEAMPEVELPKCECYPGGRTRTQHHVSKALDAHASYFGHRPAGVWPSEGSVSDGTLKVLAESGFKWAATGEAVLVNSLKKIGELPEKIDYLYRPYRRGDIVCFFRDDYLSDRIGFEYSKWNGRDAANNFIHHLEEILSQSQDENPVVSVILDGENAWEFYPYNGYYFLSDLYDALSNHPDIRMTTFSECAGRKCIELPGIVAGSWVYGTFSTWIGSEDKNRGWDLLCEAKKSYDHVMASGRLSEEEMGLADKQLSDCEGSDWFWWFGDYNSAVSVSSFDSLYRLNLANLYRILKLPVPHTLDRVISVGQGDPALGGTMRRAS
ncbi:MAG TPA: glycoside hydrolase family 57 protein, partial [Burkholderiales bacterium]|nr:glycoside hydrolase family 57 protein [Burkholderiales bacterium]